MRAMYVPSQLLMMISIVIPKLTNETGRELHQIFDRDRMEHAVDAEYPDGLIHRVQAVRVHKHDRISIPCPRAQPPCRTHIRISRRETTHKWYAVCYPFMHSLRIYCSCSSASPAAPLPSRLHTSPPSSLHNPAPPHSSPLPPITAMTNDQESLSRQRSTTRCIARNTPCTSPSLCPSSNPQSPRT